MLMLLVLSSESQNEGKQLFVFPIGRKVLIRKTKVIYRKKGKGKLSRELHKETLPD